MSLHDFSTPLFTRGLTSLAACLTKGAEHAEAHKIKPAALLDARLFPDMFPLSGQVQLACDFAKRAIARLVGIEPPKDEDVEASFDDLQARIARTRTFIQSHDAAAFAGAETRMIELKLRTEELRLSAQDYLGWFALPNFYFHVTTAYDLLRHNGVPLGKRDFVGPNPLAAA